MPLSMSSETNVFKDTDVATEQPSKSAVQENADLNGQTEENDALATGLRAPRQNSRAQRSKRTHIAPSITSSARKKKKT